MSDYNWCHGPSCHEKETQSRVRGSGDNKVLRTIKIKINSHNQFSNDIFDYFCNTHCLYNYLHKHAQAVANIAPRSKALETPIQVKKEKFKDYRMKWNGDNYVQTPYTSTRTTIKSVDNA